MASTNLSAAGRVPATAEPNDIVRFAAYNSTRLGLRSLTSSSNTDGAHATQSRSHPTAGARPWCNDHDAWLCRGTDARHPLQQSDNHGKAYRLHACGRSEWPRTHDIAGQLGYDSTGKQGADFREQATLVYGNLKAAIESVG